MPYKLMLSLLLLLTVSMADLAAQVYPGRRLVTCQRKSISYSDFFNVVYTQTQMLAFYNEEQVTSDEIISVNFRNAPLDTVLASLIGKKGLGWCYKQGTFVVSYLRREERSRTITGLIINEKGQPLEAAAVTVNDIRHGTGTGKDGRFILRDVPPGAGLSVHRAGYKPMELASYADSVLVQMIPMVAPLQTIDVRGKIHALLTGSVSSVDDKEIGEQPVNNVLSALQGRVPGLYINQTTGLPGGGYKIRLRGKNSIESVSDPLILVDGIPFPAVSFNESFANLIGQQRPNPGANIAASPLNLLTVNDIASIEVLKDADATAIYGAKGVNGVVLINSKKPGLADRGVTVNLYSGAGAAVNLIPFMDTKQYLAMRREGLANDGTVSNPVDHDVNKWDSNRYTNWQKEMIGSIAYMTDASVELKGAVNDNIWYRGSGLLRQESTVYSSRDFRYHKYGSRLQGNAISNDRRWALAVSGNYVADRNVLPAVDLTTFSTLPPNSPYDEDHPFDFFERYTDNPFTSQLRKSEASSSSFRSYINASYKPRPNLTFQLNTGFSSIKISEVQIYPLRSFAPAPGLSAYSFFLNNHFRNQLTEMKATWEKQWEGARLNLVGGARFLYEQQRQNSTFASGYPDGVPDKTLKDSMAAKERHGILHTDSVYRYHSLYGRLEYTYAKKYVISGTATRDVSARLSPAKRKAVFGAVGLAWIFGSEKWLENNRVLSYGKLRGSWGVSGNDQYRHDSYNGTFIPDSVLSARDLFGQLDYGWEKIRRAELALELGFFRDRIYGVFCYYNNRSRNQLLSAKLPGGILPVDYKAVILNRGFEMDLEATIIDKDKINWTSTFNLSLPRTRLLSFEHFDQTNYDNYYSLGKALDIAQTYELLEVDPTTGLYKFVGIDSDPTKPAEKTIGRELAPEFYGGLQHNLRFNGIELSMLFRFARQNNYNYQYGTELSVPGAIGNQPLTVEDRWQQPGDISTNQRYSSDQNSIASQLRYLALDSDRRITMVNYLRLQSLMLSYYLSPKTLKRLNIKSCKLFLQGLNLFTITNYQGRDPELVTDVETYPSLRIMTAGMQFSF
jgi:TonB-linked SusC/RagA family outer membrane protein